MKKLPGILVFFILLFIYSKFGPAIPFSTSTQGRGEPMVVLGEGSVSVTPDSAKVSLGVSESGKSLKQTQDSVNKKTQRLVSEIKKMGIDEKDIKTTSYNIYPESNYDIQPPQIIGYKVDVGYQITIHDFDKINDLLTVATANGANSIGGVSFEISDDLKETKLNEARKIAASKAKDKAEGLAKAAGITLGRIINVSEGSVDNYPRPYLTLEKSLPDAGGGDSVARPQIQPGETELSVTVSLSYEIR